MIFKIFNPKVFKKAGLKVKKYFYSPFATSILSSDQQVLEKGFINLDFGYDKTSITLFENSKLIFSKSIPIGSFHINNDLMKSVDLDKNLVSNEEKIQKELILNSGKPSNIVEKILEGKMKKYFSEVTLLNQSYILDQDKTVRDIINQYSKYEYELISFDLINL